MKVIGHYAIRESLRKAVEQNALSHAHLIVGEDGIGKSVVARELAIRILGKQLDRDYADIMSFTPSKKSIGVDYIRKLIEEINKKPYEGDKKVIIIYEGDKITTQGQNAFLKTIEEPPSGVHIIILCENLQSILETIRSRCQVHKLNRLNRNELLEYIELNHKNITNDEKDVLLAFSNGIPGRIDRFLNDNIFNDIRNFVVKLFNDITSKDINIVVNYVKYITSSYKDYYDEVLDNILFFSRDILIYKDMESEEFILNKDKLQDIKLLSNKLSFKKLNNIIKNINDTRNTLKKNVNAVTTFDVLLLNLLEV
ncbi:DNA polymerase III subunit delta' [Clostridium hydrogeniformans]|uniref:DNA polymerase III subunit delta' n=1 Tax=Clostridium hydrogeniformans TaxID=349933 RepID=UPI000691DD0E|nr:DNA polymerase III subunit delta' [Clostridium hydrogeniformans]